VLKVANVEAQPGRSPTQFTPANAAYYGRRGAAERERRFLARFQSPQADKKEQKAKLRAAKSALTAAPGAPRRSRPIDPFSVPALRHTLVTLEDLLDSPYPDVSLSAAIAIIDRYLPSPRPG
jgi:hypothetical protein